VLLTIAVVIFAAGIVLLATVAFVREQPRPLLLDRAVIVLEGVLLVRAAVDVVLMLTGSQLVHDATHLGYLVSSVALLPCALQFLEGDRSKWSTLVLGVATLAVLVVAVRLEVTTSG
jgi:hypothetical protein